MEMGSAKVRLLLFLLLLAFGPVRAQHEHEHAQPAQTGATATAPSAAKPDPRPWFLRGKRFREFNHQLPGFCLIVAGGLILAQDRLARRWPAVRYIWPCGLLLPGVYLLFLGDTEIWPFGDQNLFTLLVTDIEVIQHKLFVLILLVLGTIEVQRVRGRLTGTWSAFVFPVLAFFGAAMLLFHSHGMEEHTPEHMAMMQRIQAQHIRFAVVGMLVALSKALAEIHWVRRQLFARAWPSFMMLLGVLLLIYRE